MPPVAKKTVTIRDVAKQAGVSVATASRALNGKQVVKPGTRDRILAVMDELGFRPSPAARRLSLGRTLTVGVVVSFLTRPQAAERLRGVDAVLADSEFDLVIYNVESVQKRDHYLGSLAHSQRTDGLVVMSLPPPDEAVPALSQTPVPVVFIDVHTPSVAHMPRVVGDDLAGGSLAGHHLLGLGHRRIAFIGDALESPFGFTSSRDRELGMTTALAPAGIAIGPESIGHGAHGRYEARDLARRILLRDPRPTAIFAASDTQALGVIAAARELGLHVPDDLSVIGYDDIEAAEYVGLTTIRQQLFESGRRGAEILLAEIDRRSEEAPIAYLTPELVVRATTAPPKEGRG
ncbi:MAG TPA: LacI family DNA-binding transcriptional regulator [Patescibacteria group bacterium]|jgi:DNA-binding LacI/PurR family transcriptional regulator|nr:LacI family DNA-binding transcriptional regulator [Patescibacteria group bacterium]